MITGLPPTPLISGSGGVFAAIGSSLSYSQTATDVTIAPDLGSAITIPAASDSLAGMLDAARAATIDNLAVVASSGSYNDLFNQPDRHAFIPLIIDGSGAAIIAPITRFVYMPFAGAIAGWVLMADRSGSISIDVWKAPLGSFPPTSANSITGGAVMSLSSQTNNSNFQPPPWSTLQINAGDVLAFNVSSVATVQVVTAQLVITH